MKSFTEIKDRVKELESLNGGRDALFQEMENIYYMNWADEGRIQHKQKDAKVTLSPDPRNQLDGAVRLLVATDPLWAIEDKDQHEEIRDVADEIEQATGAIWTAAGKVAGRPVHYDAIKSGLMYDEVHLAIIPTYLLDESTKDKRILRAARRTPYLFETYNPRTCFPRWDRYGLAEHARKVTTKAVNVISDWGEEAQTQLAGRSDIDLVTVCEYWDSETHCVYIESKNAPLILVEHGLEYIPVVSSMLYGSPNLETTEANRTASIDCPNQPFLYTLYKSGLWNRQNLSLTVAYTMLFAIASNPMFLYKRNAPDKKLSIDFSRPGGVVYIDQNEDLGPLGRQPIDPALPQLMSLADNKIVESTIYKQALGQPLAGTATFSETALLSQAGRLPLITPQRQLSWLMAQAMEISWHWLKADKKAYRYKYFDVDLKDLPEDLEIDCTLDIALPQDRLQQASIAGQLTGGANPLASLEWARRNLLNIEQSTDEQKKIWIEQASLAKYQQYIQQQQALAEMQMQQAMQAAQQQQTAPPMQSQPAVPPGMGQGQPPIPGGMPPEMMSMPPQPPIPSPGMPQPGGNGREPV